MNTQVRFDAELIRRYDCNGPRYTSYPTAVQFHGGIGEAAYRDAAAVSNQTGKPLSLYVHVPFCASPCFYCGCNKIITRSPEKADTYVDYLHREIALQGALFDRGRTVEQLHFGGGTPTFLTPRQMGTLVDGLARHFSLDGSSSREFSIEIDPRTVGSAYLHDLAAMGFNRISLGVQDCDPHVQQAVNRIQPVSATGQVIDSARQAGFGSISIDLIYGLPLQTLERFDRTLTSVISLRPDRLAVYGYAHLPQAFKAQRQIRAEDLPAPAVRLALLEMTISRLTAAGYEYIGMDHFALPGDELVRAQHEGKLHRNFQGYSTRAHCDIVGMGVSSIGKVAHLYAQNQKTLRDYYAAMAANSLPILRGVALTRDDQIRREVIQQVMCNDSIDFEALDKLAGIDSRAYFASEFTRLDPMQQDGLLVLEPGRMTITDTGRLLRRNIAMVFDAYLTSAAAAPTYSRAI
jgi:oxygen-independent coproporphyrinogen III oxidase